MLGILCLALVAVAIIGVALLTGSSAGERGDGSETSSARETDTSLDGEDANLAGCVKTAVNEQGVRVPVRLPSGAALGFLGLRRSTACETIWGKVRGLPKRPTGRDRLHFETLRPEDEQRVEYSTADVFKAAFGDMLSYRPGCVRVRAYVVRDGRRGKVAETPCVGRP